MILFRNSDFLNCLCINCFEGKTAGSVFQNSDVLSNPIAGLMIGVLATVLFQSSSTTTGIAISLAVSKGR
jgi:glycerol uptake facilitator-like aquaporin